MLSEPWAVWTVSHTRIHTHAYTHTWKHSTHTHTQRAVSTCLLSPLLRLSPIVLSVDELQIEISHTNGKANWFMYREENILLCYMQKFKRIISKINMYFPFIKMYNYKVLFTGFKCHVKHALSALQCFIWITLKVIP